MLIKNSKGEEKKEKCHSHKQSKGLGRALWVYKVGLKLPIIAMTITGKPHCLSLSLAKRREWHCMMDCFRVDGGENSV